MVPPVSPTQHSNNNGALNREGGGGEGASSDLQDGVVGGGGSEEGEAWAAQESLEINGLSGDFSGGDAAVDES